MSNLLPIAFGATYLLCILVFLWDAARNGVQPGRTVGTVPLRITCALLAVACLCLAYMLVAAVVNTP